MINLTELFDSAHIFGTLAVIFNFAALVALILFRDEL